MWSAVFSFRCIAAASGSYSRIRIFSLILSVKQNLLFGRWFAPRRGREINFDAVIETLG